jgi:hypothetical protein
MTPRDLGGRKTRHTIRLETGKEKTNNKKHADNSEEKKSSKRKAGKERWVEKAAMVLLNELEKPSTLNNHIGRLRL